MRWLVVLLVFALIVSVIASIGGVEEWEDEEDERIWKSKVAKPKKAAPQDEGIPMDPVTGKPKIDQDMIQQMLKKQKQKSAMSFLKLTDETKAKPAKFRQEMVKRWSLLLSTNHATPSLNVVDDDTVLIYITDTTDLDSVVDFLVEQPEVKWHESNGIKTYSKAKTAQMRREEL